MIRFNTNLVKYSYRLSYFFISRVVLNEKPKCLNIHRHYYINVIVTTTTMTTEPIYLDTETIRDKWNYLQQHHPDIIQHAQYNGNSVVGYYYSTFHSNFRMCPQRYKLIQLPRIIQCLPAIQTILKKSVILCCPLRENLPVVPSASIAIVRIGPMEYDAYCRLLKERESKK